MRDARIDKLAAVLVNYSTAVKKGDVVRIGGEAPGLPLMEALYEQTLLAGGHPFVQVTTDTIDDALFRLGTDAQIGYASPINAFLVDHMDVYFGIWADENTKSRSNVPA